MDSQPLVSVIIPSFNYGRYLPAALNSILAQTWSNWECLIIDNESTDNSQDVARDFIQKDHRFRLFIRNNKGPSSARNKGIQEAKGVFIQFLDADDILEPEKIRTGAEYLREHPETDLVYSEVRYFRNNDVSKKYFSMKTPDREWMPLVSGSGYPLLRQLVRYNIFTVHAPFIRRLMVDKTGKMDENLKGYEDWDYWLRMAENGGVFRFIKADNSLALVRIHDGSLNSNVKEMRHYLLPVWIKVLSSGKLPLQLFPYVIFRTMEELFRMAVLAVREKDISYLIGIRMPVYKMVLLLLIMPLFIPFLLLVRMVRNPV